MTNGAEPDPHVNNTNQTFNLLQNKIVEFMLTNCDGLSGGQLHQQQGSKWLRLALLPGPSPVGAVLVTFIRNSYDVLFMYKFIFFFSLFPYDAM